MTLLTARAPVAVLLRQLPHLLLSQPLRHHHLRHLHHHLHLLQQLQLSQGAGAALMTLLKKSSKLCSISFTVRVMLRVRQVTLLPQLPVVL